MFLIFHYLLQVVVVGHTHLYVVGVGLTEIGLGIVSQIVTILIPIEWVGSRRVFNTIDMALCIRLLLEELPSTTRYFVSTRCYVWFTDTNEGTRQHNLWSLDFLNVRNTTLEHDVDIHHMALADWCNVSTRSITLLIVILIDDGDNLLLREVEDVRAT